MTRLVVGCMTGTSIDGLDAALVKIEGHGLAMRASFVRGLSRPLGELTTRLRALSEQQPITAGEIARLGREFSLLHADALRELLAAEKADLLSIHGQTIFHQPPASWQLLAPAIIAHALNTSVVSDLRAADLAAGGQGAPITPLADWILLRGDAPEARAIVNLGGFCNATLVHGTGDPRGAQGFDVCACNHLLDTIARRVLSIAYDDGGRAALAGSVDDEALDDLRGVLLAQSSARRSLGTGDELMSWVGRHRARIDGPALAATACEAIGELIAARVAGASRVLLAGGGVKNAALVKAITSCCSAPVEATDQHGIPSAYREAICMAVLGALCQDRVPITLSSATGVDKPPIAGTWVMP